MEQSSNERDALADKVRALADEWEAEAEGCEAKARHIEREAPVEDNIRPHVRALARAKTLRERVEQLRSVLSEPVVGDGGQWRPDPVQVLRDAADEVKAAFDAPPTAVLTKSQQAAWKIGIARAHKIVRDRADRLGPPERIEHAAPLAKEAHEHDWTWEGTCTFCGAKRVDVEGRPEALS